MQILDVRNPSQVTSVGQIDADLGVGNRRLLVLSGIALTDWKYDSDELAHGETQINLGVFARNLEQWSAFVGLASISNDETAFVFATDTARVELEPNTGELLLKVHTALLGEWSYLGRISYQVVLTIVRVNPHIAGTITWPKSLMDPGSEDVAGVAAQLRIMANRYEHIQPPGAFPYDKLTPVVPGQVFKVDVEPDKCIAHYRIDNPPMAMDLKVTVDPGPGFHAGAGGSIVAGQVAGPMVFKLTGSAPSQDGIDFLIGQLVVR